VLVYSPSNTPIASPPDFLQQLPVHLDCEELGVHGLLRCPTPTDMQHRRAGTTLAVDRETEGEAKRGCSLAVVEQNLTLFLFLRHTDPFTSELCDVLAAEGLLEHHLEAILNNNRQAASEKMCSAFDVMLSSALSIVSSSSNLEFRTACLDNMRERAKVWGSSWELLEGPEESLRSSYKFMFQRLRDVRNVLTERIEELGEELRSHFNIEEFSPVALPAQDSISVLGQVCCDSKGKLNTQSVVLEAGPEHGAQQVPVDLSELKEYSLFPGQRPPRVTELAKDLGTEACPAVLVACGPYTPSDSLTFDPLLDLITVIVRDRPDVCVLLGPFVDAKHEQIEKAQVTETFEAIFARCVDSILEGTKSVGCRLVFVPSQRDVHHHCIYPQPPFTLPQLGKRVTVVPDPCTLLIEGVTLGLTSTDILFHMGAEEISCAAGSDRFSRILKHLLTQRSYYPLYPPVEDMNMDYEKFQSYGQMPLTPDVLVVPSELRYFIKEVIGCVCVNPGRLTKGQVGGTYGRLLIQRSNPPEDGKRSTPCLACQVVKI
ncbi:hypothetical protein CRUP_020145, partial [Coryphaenoides rupestris]